MDTLKINNLKSDSQNQFDTMLKVTFQLKFWISLIFLIIALWALTIGQAVSYEFRNTKIESDF